VAAGSALTITKPLDSAHFRRVLGHYPTGVCVITTNHAVDGPAGMTVGSFTSVSMEPPLVAFFAMAGSSTFERIAQAGRFCVNVLGRHQEDVCRRFASRTSDKFGGTSHRSSPLGSPILDTVVAWIDCTVADVHQMGDHAAVYGTVHSLAVETRTAPLMFFQGGYGGFSAMSVVAEASADLTAQLRLADLARPHLEAVSSRYGVETHATTLIDDRLVQLAWVGASGSSFEGNKVGLRLPAVPPMGLLFHAWSGREEQLAWLASRPSADNPDLRAVYLREFDRVRETGWQAIPDHPCLRRVEATVLQMAICGQTPSLQRELESHLEDYCVHYVALAGQPDREPSGFSAPVFDQCGRVTLALTAQSFAGQSDVDASACRENLVAAAHALTAAIRRLAPDGG
jgi:flavin reductase (DIM6/NTAB) family NADH-FMN oxidoreductase RutF/DNA-binding IclR family transcriptional regulator